ALPTVQSDLYSLGAVLYFLVCGRVPFPGLADEERARHHLTSKPVPIENLRPEVPAELAQLVREIMAKSPKDRPASGAEVVARIEPLSAPARAELCLAASGVVPPPVSRDDVITPQPSLTLAESPTPGTVPTPALAIAETSPWAGLEDDRTLEDTTIPTA